MFENKEQNLITKIKIFLQQQPQNAINQDDSFIHSYLQLCFDFVFDFILFLIGCGNDDDNKLKGPDDDARIYRLIVIIIINNKTEL